MATLMNQQGGFSIVPSRAATPMQTQAEAAQSVPDGRSPNGNLPRSDITPASGPSLSHAETSSAVTEMQLLMRSTAEAVQWKCDLLND